MATIATMSTGKSVKALQIPSIYIALTLYYLDQYTRLGAQNGSQDARASSFIHLLENILPELRKRPKFILVENVAHFETSDTADILRRVFRSLNYEISEHLLSPLQFGIPNARLRYYFIARCGAPVDCAVSQDTRITDIISSGKLDIDGTCANDAYRHHENAASSLLRDYLERGDEEFDEYRIDDTVRMRSFILFENGFY